MTIYNIYKTNISLVKLKYSVPSSGSDPLPLAGRLSSESECAKTLLFFVFPAAFPCIMAEQSVKIMRDHDQITEIITGSRRRRRWWWQWRRWRWKRKRRKGKRKNYQHSKKFERRQIKDNSLSWFFKIMIQWKKDHQSDPTKRATGLFEECIPNTHTIFFFLPFGASQSESESLVSESESEATLGLAAGCLGEDPAEDSLSECGFFFFFLARANNSWNYVKNYVHYLFEHNSHATQISIA